MDFYPMDISDDTENNKKRRKRAIANIKKIKYRQFTFDILTKQVGKGNKQSLKRVKIVNEENDGPN